MVTICEDHQGEEHRDEREGEREGVEGSTSSENLKVCTIGGQSFMLHALCGRLQLPCHNMLHTGIMPTDACSASKGMPSVGLSTADRIPFPVSCFGTRCSKLS